MERAGIRLSGGIVIPAGEIRMSYVRAGGPGGQNVNKVASKAVLRFNLRDSPSIPESERRRALSRLAARLTRNGDLVLTSQTHRNQARNREAAIDRLRVLLEQAVKTSPSRRPTRPSRAANERRLAEKRGRSERKRERRSLD